MDTGYELGPDGGMLYGSFLTPPDRVPDALRELRKALATAGRGLDGATYERARRRALERTRHGAFHAHALASHVARAVCEQTNPDRLRAAFDKLERARTQDVLALASRVLQQPLIVIVGERSVRAALQWDDATIVDE